MLSHARMLVEWEITPLRALLQEGVPPLRRLADERRVPGELGILPDRHLSPAGVMDMAASLLVTGVMQQLNALVETCLHYLADRIRDDGTVTLFADRAPSWQVSLAEIEHACGTRAALLPGADDVAHVRREANALKHKGSFLIEREPLRHIRSVAGTVSDPIQKLDGVERWLIALTDLVDAGHASRRGVV
jgi:hypothetical protein